MHLISNLILLMFFGIELESVHRPIRVIPIFFAGVIAGNLFIYSKINFIIHLIY